MPDSAMNAIGGAGKVPPVVNLTSIRVPDAP